MLAGRFLSRVPESDSFPVWDEWLEFGGATGTNASDTLNSTSVGRERHSEHETQRRGVGGCCKTPLEQERPLHP